MTHVSLHRCRFVDYPPSEITSLAFSHPSSPNSARPPPSTLRLAIGRSNGSIEIWNPLSGAWHHESTLAGGKDRAIEALAWTQDYDSAGAGQLRLFSIGYSTVVTEWDLATGRPRRHLDCNGGAIWSMSAQPRRNAADVPEEEREDAEATAQKIVVGTDDGTLKLLSTASGDLSFVRNLVRAGPAKARVLSLAWKDRFTVVAGLADSKIRVWDVRSGRNIARMSVNREHGRDVLVWALKVTKGGDIVSGDSKGEVCFWDSKNWTLKQRLKAHEADCLTLEVGGRNGDSVMSGGADMRTAMYQIAGKSHRWGEVAHRKYHRHDVRAMAAYESGPFSVVVSGGVDMTPIIVPFRNFTTENHLTLPLVPQSPIVTSVPESRLIMSQWEREIKIWKLEELSEELPQNLENPDQGRKLLSRIILSNDEYITSATLSAALPDDGGYILAVSTIAEIKLFNLRHPKPNARSEALLVNKIALPETLVVKRMNDDDDSDSEDSDDEDEMELSEVGARILKFSPDGKRLLIITPDSRVIMATMSITAQPETKPIITIASPLYELPRGEISAVELSLSAPTPKPSGRKNRQKLDTGTHGVYVHLITRAAFSPTSRRLALCDLSGTISTYTLTSPTTWTPNPSIPRLTAAATILSFRPPSPDTITEDSDLLALPADTQNPHLFTAATGTLAQWSRDNPMPECAPIEFAALRDCASGVFWEDHRRAWIHGAGWVWMFDFSREWPRNSHGATPSKRKRVLGISSNPTGLVPTTETETDESSDDEAGGVGLRESPGPRKKKGQKPFWGTNRYRGLLGFLPVGGREMVEHVGGSVAAVEVAVVERPAWDVGLPPRF
ncbi:WD40-repeat-containing domain protein, partial [Geopyxis carbonaria]